MVRDRLFGSAGSLSANLILFGAIAAGWPQLGECEFALCWHREAPPVELVVRFQPYLDNPAAVGWSDDPAPDCPSPQATEFPVSLDHAPLPPGFDPHDFDEPLFACIYLDESTKVRDASLLTSTGDWALDAATLRLIAREWAFSPTEWGSEAPAWHRVRLDAGFGLGDFRPPMAALRAR